VLEARGITRRFARTLALDGVDFHARAGEIHALVGENGAGKSTLIKIFAGRLKPDAGRVTIAGEPLAAGSANRARAAGVAAVYQSPMLFERMTWEENLALAGFGDGTGARDPRAAAARAAALARDLGFVLPPAGATLERRSVADRVRLEIIRALGADPRVLILDEPTGLLAPAELAAFLAMLRRLRGAGRAVVIVTHKLAEAIAVADRITVLRRGRRVAECRAAATDAAELAHLMLGDLASAQRAAPVADARIEGQAVADPGTTDPRCAAPVLTVEALTLDDGARRLLDSIGFTLTAGEIAGVAGVDGNGQAELIEVLAGMRTPGAGRIVMGRADDDASSGGAARSALRSAGGLAVIAQNRDSDGLILDMTLWENILLARPVRTRFTRRGWLQRSRAAAFCGELLERFQIRTATGPAGLAGALSGGNRQRLAVARAMAGAPRVIVAHDIGRGLDLRAAEAVRQMLREFAAAGGAVMLISGDLDELLELCGRLYVLSGGRLIETAAGDRDPARLGLLMAGAAS